MKNQETPLGDKVSIGLNNMLKGNVWTRIIVLGIPFTIGIIIGQNTK